MPLENIANENLEIGFTSIVVPPDAVYGGDQGIDPIKVVPIKAPKSKSDGGVICVTSIILLYTAAIVCPFTSATYTFVAGGGTVVGAAAKCKANNQFVLLKGDMGTCAGSWTLTATPFTPLVCSCSVEIVEAGQELVDGS